MGCCCTKAELHDERSDQVRKHVGEAAKQLDQFRNQLSLYANSLEEYSKANCDAANQCRDLVIHESAEVKVAMAHFCDHFEACHADMRSFAETVEEWGDTENKHKGQKLALVPWYDDHKIQIDEHDQIWLELCSLQDEFEALDPDTDERSHRHIVICWVISSTRKCNFMRERWSGSLEWHREPSIFQMSTRRPR